MLRGVVLVIGLGRNRSASSAQTCKPPAVARVAALGMAGMLTLALAACGRATPPAEPSGPPANPGPSSTSEGTASPGATREPTPEPTGSTVPPLPTGPDRLRVELLAQGLEEPIGITNAGDGSGRLYVNERAGRVRVVEPDGRVRPEPFVDLSDRILAGGERGLLGLVFHPDFERNRRVFVHYSRAGDGATVVSELTARDGLSADPDSERVLLTHAQPFPNHNGGQLEFGPDGYLYIGLGDGGSGGDPFGNGQNRQVLLGKVLRIDVDAPPDRGKAYAVPPDNPFAPQGIRPGEGLPEIWAYGLRNPWRFSFDPEWGDLYIADVGQNAWEEINRQPGDSRGGENYGWAVMEGRHCTAFPCDQSRFVLPIAEYSHDQGCSVTGGHVYRGEAQPQLNGVYVSGDYCSGLIFTLQVDEGTSTPKVVLESGLQVTAFGTDEDGEIYVADLGGGAIYHVLVDG
ncbi:MAG TPA: PQQ-dependent sugar dehydrogenase [candidate division Zixibacteria bacterium]|nr:PQQ-dependent sugar dehydrogenase [candidate division Zixibacteria bacterium]